jgi:hypothetical protein
MTPTDQLAHDIDQTLAKANAILQSPAHRILVHHLAEHGPTDIQGIHEIMDGAPDIYNIYMALTDLEKFGTAAKELTDDMDRKMARIPATLLDRWYLTDEGLATRERMLRTGLCRCGSCRRIVSTDAHGAPTPHHTKGGLPCRGR